MAQGKVVKIYDLKTIGYDDVLNRLNQIVDAFTRIKNAKRSASEKISMAQDTAEVSKYAAEIAKLKKEEAELRVEREKLINEAKAHQAQRQADLTLKEKERQAIEDEKLKQQELRTEREKTALQIKQEQLQRQQEISQRNAQRNSIQAVAGSYNALRKEYNELSRAVKSVPKGDNVISNGQTLSYDEAIAKLKELAAAEQDFRRQFSKDGHLVSEYTSGIVDAFKKLGLSDLITSQVTRSQQRLGELKTNFETLRQELVQLQVTGQGSLEAIEQSMIQNRQEAITLERQVGQLQNELRGFGDVGNQITTSITNGFRNLRNQIGQLIVSYIGIQAIISGMQQSVDTARELSDSTTSLEIELGKAAGGVDDLVSSLGDLNTRTKLTALEDIANIALRAGTAEENLLGVTEAVDKTKVAFGKDFGDVESGTETFAKLINIFYEDREITGDRILKIGNSIRTLANETVASVPFINDFAGRMAGLRQISNITLPDVIGLGAGFEEFKQSAEVSSTALVKIIPKLANDVAKYAQIVNMPIAEFRKLLNENPAEALIKISETLVKSGEGIEGVASALGDAELGAGRVTTILGTLGGKADVFRARIARAKDTISETTAIEEAFRAKNENLAASLDKIGKKFADAAGSKAFMITLTALSSILLFLFNWLPVIIGLLGTWTTIWALANAHMIKARIVTLAHIIAMQAQAAATTVQTIVLAAYNTSIALYTGLTTRAAAATGLLSIAMRALPFGIILTIIGILIASYRAFASSVTGTTEALRKHALQLQIANEVNNNVNDSISKQTSNLDALRRILLSNTASLDTRKKALEDMIAIDSRFSEIMDGQIISLAKLDKAYRDVTESIRLRAQAEAAAQLAQEKNKDVLNISTIRQRIESELAIQNDSYLKNISGFNEDELKFLRKIIVGNDLRVSSYEKLMGTDSALQQLLVGLKQKETEATDVYIEYSDFLSKKQQEINDKEAARFGSQQQDLKDRAAASKASVDELEKLVQGIDEKIKALPTDQTAERDKLTAERDRYQKEIDDFLQKENKEKPYRGARLSGTQRDDLKEIDAVRDQLLADDKLKYAQGEILEEVHLQNILQINQDAIDKKLQFLKGTNAEEKKVIAELKLDRITQERQTNEQLFKLQETALKDQLDQARKNAELAVKEITDDPRYSDSEKAQAKLDADKAILQAQVTFNSAIDDLEKQYAVKSKKNSEDRAIALRQINGDLSKDLLALSKATVTDMEKASATEIAAYKSQIAKQREEILNATNLSYLQKNNRVDTLDKAEKIGVLSREIIAMQQQLPVYKKLLDDKKITEKEYNDFITQLYEKQGQLYQATTDAQKSQIKSLSDALKGALATAMGVSEAYAQVVYDALAGSFDLAKEAMNGYFDAERNRIEQSKQANLERLDIEKQQVLSKAQSKAEEERIEKQYDIKKKLAEQEAGRRLKEVKKNEAKLALATELANIAASAAANIYNGVTFGAAGAAQFAIMAGLALGRYAIRIGDINSTQFARGGAVPSSGGRFGGRAHKDGGTPFVFKGNTFEAEADELAVIRTKNAAPGNYTISGNHTQIASALNEIGGGVRFAAGAKVSKFEYGGSLGESLQAPVFVPAVNSTITNSTSGQQEKVLDLLTDQAKALQAVNDRIDRLQVVQDTRTVTSAQNKLVKQTNIGTL